VDVSAPLSITIPHRLGREEAVRRLKAGLGHARTGSGGLIAIDQEVWSGDQLQFQMRAIGQTTSGMIEVLEDHVQVDVTLPWLLAKIAERLIPAIREQTTLLLEKK
jgi:Putative polyhydroxyalkanoic acid system protein (PHA_gran_rgn)